MSMTQSATKRTVASEPWRNCMKSGEVFGQVFYCTKGGGPDGAHMNFDSGMAWTDGEANR